MTDTLPETAGKQPEADQLETEPGTGRAAPRRWLWIWDVYFLVCAGVVAVLLADEKAVSGAARVTAIALLALIGAWWVTLGRRAAKGADGSRASWVFVAGLAVLFTSAVLVCETSAFALAALCPMVFLTLQNVRAVLVVSGLSAVPLVIVTLRTGSLAKLQYMVPSTVLSLTFAVLAGTYIDKIARQNEERARMIAELRQRRAEIARLSHTAGVADERARMASEIHDTLAQGFTSIITLLQAAELRVVREPGEAARYLSMATRTARDNLAEARGLVAALTPPGLRAETLADAVRRLAERLAEEKGIEVTADVDGAPDRLGTAVEVVILRTLQEGLANIRKHANARTVSVELTELASSVLLVLIDDGAGFDPAATGRGFGLPGMRKRAEQVDGVLTIRSATGCGTILELEVPR